MIKNTIRKNTGILMSIMLGATWLIKLIFNPTLDPFPYDSFSSVQIYSRIATFFFASFLSLVTFFLCYLMVVGEPGEEIFGATFGGMITAALMIWIDFGIGGMAGNGSLFINEFFLGNWMMLISFIACFVTCVVEVKTSPVTPKQHFIGE
jgi:hypothetical protein